MTRIGMTVLIVATGCSYSRSFDIAGPPIPHEWLVCAKDSDCTSVEVGCYSWQPVNKIYASEAKRRGSIACKKSMPAGPQTPAMCVENMCMKGPVISEKTVMVADVERLDVTSTAQGD